MYSALQNNYLKIFRFYFNLTLRLNCHLTCPLAKPQRSLEQSLLMLRAEMAPYWLPTLVLPRQSRRAWFWSREGKRIRPWDKTVRPTGKHTSKLGGDKSEIHKKIYSLKQTTISKLLHPIIFFFFFAISKISGYRECHLLCACCMWGVMIVCMCICTRVWRICLCLQLQVQVPTIHM